MPLIMVYGWVMKEVEGYANELVGDGCKDDKECMLLIIHKTKRQSGRGQSGIDV